MTDRITPKRLPSSSMSLKQGVDLQTLKAQKEQELRELEEFRISSLEKTLEEKEEELSRLKDKFDKVKDDYNYNIKLLEERDDDLHKYEVTFQKYAVNLREKEKKIDDQSMKLTDLQTQIEELRARRSESDVQHQKAITDLKARCEKQIYEKDNVIAKQKAEYSQLMQNLEAELKRKESDLENLRQDLQSSFEQSLRTQEATISARESSLRNEIIRKEQEVIELEATVERHLKEADEAKNKMLITLKSNQELEETVKRLEWQLEQRLRAEGDELARLETQNRELKRLKDVVASDSEAKVLLYKERVQQLEETLRTEREDHARVLHQYQVQKNSIAEEVSLAAQDRIDSLEHQLSKAQRQLKVADERASYAESQLAQYIRSGQAQQDYKVTTLEDRLAQTDAIVDEIRNQLWAREREVQGLQKRLDVALRSNENLKSLVRESDERVAEQQQLRETLETKQEQELIELRLKLDVAVQEKQRLEDELKQRSDQIHNLRSEYDDLHNDIDALKQTAPRGLRSSRQSFQPAFAGDLGPASPLPSLPGTPRSHAVRQSGSLVKKLQTENEELRSQNAQMVDIISEMRSEIEHLHEQIQSRGADRNARDQPDPQPEPSSASAGPLLQDEVEILRRQNESLQQHNALLLRRIQHLQSGELPADTSHRSGDALVEENTALRRELKRTQGQLAKLRREREKLMDISNMLKADLYKAVQASSHKSQHHLGRSDSPPERDDDPRVHDSFDSEAARRALKEEQQRTKHYMSRVTQAGSRGKEIDLALDGANAPAAARPGSVKMTHRTTASQEDMKRKLKTLQRRKKPSVRNYAIKAQ